MKVAENVTVLTGRTPLMLCSQIMRQEQCAGRLFVKLEYLNPAGSIRDRVAKYVMDEAIRRGLITKDSIIIQPMSGDMGVGLASLAAVKGHQIILTVPETIDVEKRIILESYGATVILTDAEKGLRGAVEKAKELSQKIPNSFLPTQLKEDISAQAHRQTTGPEIWEDTDGNVDIVVAAVLTGGTIVGVGDYLRDKKKDLMMVAACMKGQETETVKRICQESCDEMIAVEEQAALLRAKQFALKEGVLVGSYSGMVLEAAIKVADREENKNKTIVAILPDGKNFMVNV